ncbi:M20/M25/M40 family metallo-hydrolase [Alkalihalobacillus pseudalcaliphilus]|uniref:M20/M25/M40 family metallo-hydrolase n=1 Tax=Alkalihalobacillus pseudalcaliphilus TaxID=79884 RepID=UPI00069F3545|nr:M20/M25/M40 family metallo-hydrolase [Alkalihalobacillus pseudalcaliphilus]
MKKMKLFSIMLIGSVLLMACGTNEDETNNQAEDDVTTEENTPTETSEEELQSGEIALTHVEYLSGELGQRIAASETEEEAGQYVKDQFEQLGYETEVQPFTYEKDEESFDSKNIIAFKEGQSEQSIIVGAHFDSVSEGLGVDDNASGVGVMLEAAERLKDIETPYSIIFIGFGAEEVGLKGSNHYVSEMSAKEVEQTVGMINLDSLVSGDKMYVHGSAGENSFIRDLALDLAIEHDLDIEINPGLNADYPEGTTGDWSDHAAFNAAGIPYAYFEATNWEIGDLDGYTQTEEHGSFWHTENDTLEVINDKFPGRVEERLASFSTLLTELLLALEEAE